MSVPTASDCSVVAFYGLRAEPEALARLYEETLEWFEAHACHPDKMSVHGEGFSGKLGAFSRADSQLRKQGFHGVRTISVYSLLPDAVLPPRDWRVTASISLEHSIADIAADASLPDAERSMLDYARRIIQHLRPHYGIGYRRERRLGPDLYAWGINYGVEAYSGPEYEESVKVSRWADVGMVQQVYRQGLLRDVYPQNFLTEAQLVRSVAGVPLRDWIAQDKKRGTLTAFEQDVSLWVLDDAAVPAVRQELQRHAVLFDPTSIGA